MSGPRCNCGVAGFGDDFEPQTGAHRIGCAQEVLEFAESRFREESKIVNDRCDLTRDERRAIIGARACVWIKWTGAQRPDAGGRTLPAPLDLPRCDSPPLAPWHPSHREIL